MHKIIPVGNSTYPKGGVSCSKDSFLVNETLVFQIKFCCNSPALRLAAFQDQNQAFSHFFKLQAFLIQHFSCYLFTETACEEMKLGVDRRV